jgi:hypothetical protein
LDERYLDALAKEGHESVEIAVVATVPLKVAMRIKSVLLFLSL